MLVLTRKEGERVLIGDGITVTVIRVQPGRVRLGIEAPRETGILRSELDISTEDDHDDTCKSC